ncbi:MAG: 4Fe-4S dicluster domain-containing protein [Desulfobacteraceae bacterium]|nr:4Fe-4S dicluster domain-containing protein [Desulfobacteraceae bacterium]
MADVYERLAKHLDNLPAGYPATDSGIEIKILKHLFTPEEAETTIALTMLLEPAGDVAKKLGKDEPDVEKLLYSMSEKGLIFRSGKGGKNKYMAAQFVVGIWEYNVNNLNEELIRDVNEYIPQLLEGWKKHKTKQIRVIPVSESIPTEMNIMPYEQAENIIKKQSKILVAPCICRKEHNMIGGGCDRPSETCLIFGGSAFFYEENGIGRSVSQEEAVEILHKGIEAGLVLQPSNSQKPYVICMCCGCCCQILKNLNKLDEPANFAYTNHYVTVSDDDCTGCGSCEDICPMDAINVEDDLAVVNMARCIGCALCHTRCEFDAINLVEKEESEKLPIPGNTVETYMIMAQERGLL